MVSVIPDLVFIRYQTLFTDKEDIERVDWHLREKTLLAMGSSLSSNYKTSVEDIHASSFEGIDFNQGFQKLQSELAARISSGKYDLVLIIAPISPKGASALFGRTVRGGDSIESTYILVALEGRTFDVAGIAYSGRHYYVLTGPRGWAGESIKLMGRSNSELVERTINSLLMENIPISLSSLGLRTQRSALR